MEQKYLVYYTSSFVTKRKIYVSATFDLASAMRKFLEHYETIRI